MSKRLVILASSPTPDVYFNVISHNARLGVNQFVIAVVGMPGLKTPAQTRLDIEHKLHAFVDSLIKGDYRSSANFDEPAPLTKPRPMKQFFDEVTWGALDFQYKTLEESELRDFLTQQRAANASFDVTACKNAVLAGAVAWLVAKGGSPMHTFEIKRKMTHGQGDLYPYLKPAEFEYRDLSDSVLIRKATWRVKLATINRAKFWTLAVILTVAMGLATLFLPPNATASIFAVLATLATVLSAAGIFIRYPD
ncbi:hypothetical protein [Microbacterium sp. Root280D1]|uniref:hypothetical protein n=1 Tax=Microbacterium sp. Root280D1 TaxID=1736510 RepID=UPI0006F4A1BC|nr:hypothetical protein [Microbacterium sp. Root280D1]KRD53937.1 hypothetical protein ASE34_02275 [Microbacterium sp. Root280D1]